MKSIIIILIAIVSTTSTSLNAQWSYEISALRVNYKAQSNQYGWGADLRASYIPNIIGLTIATNYVALTNHDTESKRLQYINSNTMAITMNIEDAGPLTGVMHLGIGISNTDANTIGHFYAGVGVGYRRLSLNCDYYYSHADASMAALRLGFRF